MKKLRAVSLLSFALLLAPTAALAANNTVILTPSQDNTLYEFATGGISNGAGSFLFTGKIRTGGRRRAALQFDVAGNVPAGSIIQKATLRIVIDKTVSGAADFQLHRLQGAWGEGTSNAGGAEGRGTSSTAGDATWIHSSFPNTNWANIGGDFEANPSAVVSISFGASNWSTDTMATDVQMWLDNPSSNFGWIMRGPEVFNSTAKRIISKENAAVANRPTLTLEYYASDGLAGTVNSGAGPVADVVFINGSPGDSRRVVSVGLNQAITLSFNAPPGAMSGRYAMWVWAASPCNPIALQTGPNFLGTVVNPIPVAVGAQPQPFRCLRSPELPARLCQGVLEVQSARARVPWSITNNAGASVPGTFTVQAIVQDPGAGNAKGFSVTNAVVLVIE